MPVKRDYLGQRDKPLKICGAGNTCIGRGANAHTGISVLVQNVFDEETFENRLFSLGSKYES